MVEAFRYGWASVLARVVHALQPVVREMLAGEEKEVERREEKSCACENIF